MQRAFGLLLFGGRQETEHLTQPLEGRLAAQFLYNILFGLCDHESVTDRAASLRYDRADANSATDKYPYRTLFNCLTVVDQSIATRLMRAAGHAADRRPVRIAFPQLSQKGFDRGCKWLSNDQCGR